MKDRLSPIEQLNSHYLTFGLDLFDDFGKQLRVHESCRQLVILRVANWTRRAAQVARAQHIDVEEKTLHANTVKFNFNWACGTFNWQSLPLNSCFPKTYCLSAVGPKGLIAPPHHG